MVVVAQATTFGHLLVGNLLQFGDQLLDILLAERGREQLVGEQLAVLVGLEQPLAIERVALRSDTGTSGRGHGVCV